MRWRWFLRATQNPDPIGPATQYTSRSGAYLRTAPDSVATQPERIDKPAGAEPIRTRLAGNRGSHWRST